VHVTAPTANTAVGKQSTPMKAPPGLDPSARVFQPTDDARTGHSQSPPPVSASASKAERQWKYGADPASYSYSTDGASLHHHSPAVHASVPAPTSVPVQQTVTFRMSAAGPPPAASAPAPVPPVVIPPSQQQVSFKEHSPHVQYPDPSTIAPMAAVAPHAVDYRAARPRNGPPPSESVDMYAHMAMQHGNMGMYRQPNVMPGGYNMPMASMGMPVYDPQMVYMHHDPAVMQMAHYGDGTMWYNVPQGMQPGMPQGMPMPGGPSQGGADGTGGTVYYPLPPAPPANE
jgi:hypothetical protein